MDRAAAIKILDEALDKIGEHFDAVQIHVSWMDDGDCTRCVHRGSGNWYARESMSREFIEQNAREESADFIAQKLDPPEPPEDWQKLPHP